MKTSWLMAGATACLFAACAQPAAAAHRRSSPPSRWARLEALLRQQAADLRAQEEILKTQQARIDDLTREAEEARHERELAQVTSTAPPPGPPPATPPTDANAVIATQRNLPPVPSAAVTGPNSSQASNGGPALVAPVGEAPPDTKVEIAALPEESTVLTPRGHWYVEPSFTYTRSSADVLVFRGVEIVTGVQIGLLQANSAARNTFVETMDVRYGLTSRLEIEGRVPAVQRDDRIQTVAQRDQTVTQSQSLSAETLGDVEFAARYQFNEARPERPTFIGGLRYKSNTGRGPFDLDYDEFGAATSLATGSGFQSIEPSINMLIPTDPAVIFAGVSYIHNFGRDINKTIGGALLSNVDPGDSIGLTAGFGFALNPKFSFSLGTSYNHIFPTYSVLNGTRQRSNVLGVGALTFGWSYALNSRIAIANNFQFGVTSDAPDFNVIFRVPIRF